MVDTTQQIKMFSFQTFDHLTLHGHDWPIDSPRALICLVHGYGEHCRRYDHVAATLNAAGYTMTAFDLRGHGRSDGPRGYTPSYPHLMADIRRFLRLSREKFSDLPTFLYGHSMGGNLSLNYVLRTQPNLAGLIVTSPWLALTDPPNPNLVKVNQFIGRFYQPFAITQPPYEGDVLSRDPVYDDAFQPDPLTHGVISNALYDGVSRAADWVQNHAHELPLPTLLMHGTGDKLTSFDATQQFAQAAPAAQLTFHAWPDYYHELHNDLGKEAVFEVLIEWVEELIISN